MALSRQLALQSAVRTGTDPDLASLLAIHAYRTSPTVEAVTSLFNAAALPFRRRLAGHGGPVRSVAFSADGHTLTSAGEDSTARVWEMALPDLEGAVTRICRAVGRDLTRQGRETYLPDQTPKTVCPPGSGTAAVVRLPRPPDKPDGS